ncbi:MAG: hypothetical protein KC978_18280, partial [Candidatus Omnitrophica bacterium]|nr:hypothetical protein [Candidatus Omnitrophota bacterium]
SNTTASTNAWLGYTFRNIDTTTFNTLETRVSRDTTQANQLEYFQWLDDAGYADSDSAQVPFTDGAGFETHTIDLVALDWGIPQGPATLNNPGGTYSSHFPPNANETTMIDYLRIRPANYFGPSAAVTAGAATAVSGKLILDEPLFGTGVVVSGTGAHADGAVELFVEDLSVGSVQANFDGSFSFPGINLNLGEKLVATVSQVWNFNTDGDFEGWTNLPGTSASEVSGGSLRLTADASGNTTWAIGTGDPGTDNTPKVIDPDITRVFEMRYRITGVGSPGTSIAFPVNSGGFAGGQLNHQSWNAQINADWITTTVDLSTLNDGSLSPFYVGQTIIQLVVGVNGLASGDIVEIDYIRLSEGFQWDFTHPGDEMDWTIQNNVSDLTASGGNLVVTASDVQPGLLQPFSWFDTDYYSIWSTQVSATAGSQAQFETLQWIDNGGADTYGANGNIMTRLFTDDGNFQEATVDLNNHINAHDSSNPTWGEDPTSKALFLRPIENAVNGDTATIDYLRLFPANAFGPSDPVFAIGEPPSSVKSWELYE